MRLTTNMIFDTSLSALNRANKRLNQASEQLNSGEQFQRAGENPTGMARKLSLTREIDQLVQYGHNASLLKNALSQEESVLDSLNGSLMSASTLVQRANNGSLNATDRDAIAAELEGLQQQMFDLMNAKNAQGDYIFSGTQGTTPPFSRNGVGEYLLNGDGSTRYLQVGKNQQIAASQSGMELFQRVATRRTASADGAGLSVRVAEQGAFDAFYRNHYDTTGAGNGFTLENLGGMPEGYQILDAQGDVLQTGTLESGQPIGFNGLELTPSLAAGESQGFTLDAPRNDNILNGLSDVVAALRDTGMDDETRQEALADAAVHITRARERIDDGLGKIGGRFNTLEQAEQANQSLEVFNQQARAELTETDLYEVISSIAKEEAAITAAQSSFARVSRLTLFDYIR